MSDTIPKNLTFVKQVVDKATALMQLRDFGDNLSGFLSQLVREEYERRHGPVMFPAPLKEKPQPNTSKRSAESPSPANSRIGKAKGRRHKSAPEFGKG